MPQFFCRNCKKFLWFNSFGEPYCSARCSIQHNLHDAPSRRQWMWWLVRGASAAAVAAVSRGAVYALQDDRWKFQFGVGSQFFAEHWLDSQGQPALWDLVNGYMTPKALALFRPSAEMTSGSVNFKVRVGRSVGFAVRAQSGKKLAYYDLALRQNQNPTRPLQLLIHEVNGANRTTIWDKPVDSLTSLNRSSLECSVTLDREHLAASVDGTQVADWPDSLGRGSGGIGLVRPEESLVYGGELVVTNAMRDKLADSLYQAGRLVRAL